MNGARMWSSRTKRTLKTLKETPLDLVRHCKNRKNHSSFFKAGFSTVSYGAAGVSPSPFLKVRRATLKALISSSR